MIVCNDALRFVSFMVFSARFLRFTNVPRVNSLGKPRSCPWRVDKCRPVSTESARSTDLRLGLFIHPLKRSSKPQSTLVAHTFLAKAGIRLPICFRIRSCDLLRLITVGAVVGAKNEALFS
jgi:hypothetical protein